jgi:hypothetical protein
MQLPLYIKKAATFADEIGTTQAVFIQCDDSDHVIVKATDGKAFCQYEVDAITEGAWVAAIHPKDWTACTSWKSPAVSIDIKDQGDSVCVGAFPPTERNHRVTVDKAEMTERKLDLETLKADEYTVAKVDPAYLKKIAEAAIAAKAGSVLVKIPTSENLPLVITGEAVDFRGGQTGPLFFAIAQMAHDQQEAE